MKTHKKNLMFTIALFGIGISSASAASIVQTAWNGDWNGAAWGSPAAAPTSGNDYFTAVGGNGVIRASSNGANSTFGGGSLTVITGTTLLMKNETSATNPAPNTATINGTLTFDGGLLNLGPNAATNASFIATQFIITANGGTFQSGFSGRNLTLEGTLTGVGPISIIGNGGTRVVTFSNLLSYTGDITVSQDMGLAFGVDYIFTGGLNLSTAASSLKVQNGQTLTFTQGKLVDFVNGAVAEGTYTGAGLTALGANYQDFGGTIIVTAAIPEPSAVLLGGLGLLALLRHRRS